jgi:hypothetical protein
LEVIGTRYQAAMFGMADIGPVRLM